MIRLLTLLLLCLPSWLSAQLVETASSFETPKDLERQLGRLAPRLIAATVAIGEAGSPSSGSGVIIDAEGLILTAAHVVSRPGATLKVLLADGRTFDAIGLGVNNQTDAGMARIQAPGPFPFCPAIHEKAYQVADAVIAVGHPGGPMLGRPPVVRLGRINRAGSRSGFSDPIESTCTVISGDSGGPLFDLFGRVIGIHSNIAMPWSANHHVPLPSFRTDWDALLDSQTIGGSSSPLDQIDDPFRSLREEAIELLGEQEESKPAQLRTPHTYARAVDRFGEARASMRPHLGLHLDLNAERCRVSRVVPDSPSAKAGIMKSDEIIQFGEHEISNTYGMVRHLLKAPVRTTNVKIRRGTEELAFAIKAEPRPQRRMLAHPYAGALQSMLSGTTGTPTAKALKRATDAFLSELPDAAQHLVEVLHHEEKVIALATTVQRGHFVTKASVLGKDATNATLRIAEETYSAEILATDKELDLALLQVENAPEPTPIVWRAQPIATAKLLLSPLPNGWQAGIATQPVRPAPEVGYDHRHIIGTTPPYTGLVFSENEDRPTVVRVDPDSPADVAEFLEGDVIEELGRERMEDSSAIEKRLRNVQPGEPLAVKVRRDGGILNLSLTVRRPDGSPKHLDTIARGIDQSLLGYSLPKKLSNRRQGFPAAIYHDTILTKTTVGGPLIDLSGNVVGVNISRSLRHRSLALPAASVLAFLDTHLKEAQ